MTVLWGAERIKEATARALAKGSDGTHVHWMEMETALAEMEGEYEKHIADLRADEDEPYQPVILSLFHTATD